MLFKDTSTKQHRPVQNAYELVVTHNMYRYDMYLYNFLFFVRYTDVNVRFFILTVFYESATNNQKQLFYIQQMSGPRICSYKTNKISVMISQTKMYWLH